MLQAIDLTREYQHCKQTFYAVDHVNFSLKKGTFTVLMGESGSGKSSLFHMLTGMTKPSAGEVLFEGKSITKMKYNQLAKLRSTEIGYILQGQNLLQNFNIGQNICMPNYLGEMLPDTEEYMKELLEEFQLGGMEKEMPSTLSGGEQRRIAIARALIHKPKLIIADEPTSNLDSKNAALILDYFQKAKQNGTTILISTHDRNAADYGDALWTMDNGKLTIS